MQRREERGEQEPGRQKKHKTETGIQSGMIAVIGAGLAGSISTIFLAKAGYHVVLLEAKSRPMEITSKIPVHLHSGGLYEDKDVIKHCLLDSINFKQVLPFSVVDRPTAFAVMKLSDGQLEIDASILYKKSCGKETLSFSELSAIEKERYKSMALINQEDKWRKMKNRFEHLKAVYDEVIKADPVKKVFGEVDDFFIYFDAEDFSKLKDKTDETSGSLKYKSTIKLSKVTDSAQILGVIMSSEVGLNMIRAGAGIELELEKLKDSGKITLLYNCNVEDIKKSEKGFDLKFRVGTYVDDISIEQVVNATGYQAKTIDMKMGIKKEWAVDIKGAGLIELTSDEFSGVPEVFFTEAAGMSHFSPFNLSFAGINYCVEGATYVRGGKIEYGDQDDLTSSASLMTLRAEFLDKPIDDVALLLRTQACIEGCSRFLPNLKNVAKPIGYVSGALGLMGGLESRDSKEVYYSEAGYHAVNLAKGGGAVSTAMALVHKVEMHDKKAVFSFPSGSCSEIPRKFRFDLQDEQLSSQAQKRCESLHVPAEIFGSSEEMQASLRPGLR